MLIKNNHKHPILQTIYPDRFMLENREKVEDLRKTVSILRKKIAYLKTCRQRYTEYNDSNKAIEDAFELVLHFYSNQGKE